MANCHVEGEGSHHVASMSRCLWRSNDGDRVTSVCVCVCVCLCVCVCVSICTCMMCACSQTDNPRIPPNGTPDCERTPKDQTFSIHTSHLIHWFHRLQNKLFLSRKENKAARREDRTADENPICHSGEKWKAGDVSQMWWCNASVDPSELI